MTYNKKTRKEEFLKMIDNSGVDLNETTRLELLNDMEEYYKEITSKIPCKSTNRWNLLKKQWYDALPIPDYSVYSHENFFIGAFLCWVMYSRKFIKNMRKLDIFDNLDTIVDLGCGPGFTTKELNEVFKPKRTIGTNIKNTWQWTHAKTIGIDVVEDIKDVDTQIDLVVAFEYFEHIEDPLTHLTDILSHNPKILAVRNGWNSFDVGHFFEKSDNMEKKFKSIMNAHGYTSTKQFFNDEPKIWVKTPKT